MGAMNALEEAGVRVPEDASVIGIDDIHRRRGPLMAILGFAKQDVKPAVPGGGLKSANEST